MNTINFTPHAVNIYDENNNEIANIQPSGFVARISTSTVLTKVRDGIPLYQTTVMGEPVVVDKDGNEVPFPEQKDDTIIVVSGIFRSYFDRPDLYQPGRLLRDENGQVVGCVGLSR